MSRLLKDVPSEPKERTEEQQATWLLAHMLDWHRREEKAPWWEYFRLAELGDEELLDENAGVAGLELVGVVGGTDKCPVHRYRYPAQDTDVSDEDPLHKVGGDALGSVVTIDTQARTIDIKKRSDAADFHPTAAFAHSVVTARAQAEALFRLGEWVAENGVDETGPHRAARDLLLGRPPRLRSSSSDDAPLHKRVNKLQPRPAGRHSSSTVVPSPSRDLQGPARPTPALG